MQKVDVMVPLYKPGQELYALLEGLSKQTVPVNRIYLVNTERAYYDAVVGKKTIEDLYGDKVVVTHISKEEFDHGNTRHQATVQSDADVFVMMTQDALPAGTQLIEKLLEALQDEEVAVAYARQLPAADCNTIERYTRKFNYPDKSRVKSLEDLNTLGIKTYFCSNVCAAYKKDIYEKMGGFVRRTVFNEDMIYAAGAIKQGYKVAYVAEAEVYHSHNYTNKQQFKRNFDLGASQAEHPEVFRNVPSEKEGAKMVSDTTVYLLKHKFWLLPYFYIQCFCKYAGYFLGKRYKKLPGWMIKRCAMSPGYFKDLT